MTYEEAKREIREYLDGNSGGVGRHADPEDLCDDLEDVLGIEWTCDFNPEEPDVIDITDNYHEIVLEYSENRGWEIADDA